MIKIANYFKQYWLVLSLFMAGMVAAQTNQYATLAYHDVVDANGAIYHQVKTDPKTQQSDVLKRYYPQSISKKNLIRHFNWLKQNGYHVISWQDVLASQTGKKTLPDKAVLLTFDDGYESFYRIVYPLLKEYQYPAVLAIVTSIVDTPANQMVTFGDTQISRGAFVTWPQIKEMSDSGLVEIASHTHQLHRAIKANPGGSLFPAVFSAEYRNGQYETRATYAKRLRNDFQTSAQLIKQHTGKMPDVLVWPYGQFNDQAWHIATELGYKHHFTLLDELLNPKPNLDEVGRFLVEEETLIETLSEYLNGRLRQSNIERIMHVDLDYVYDDNPTQMSKNIDALIERVYQSGATTVYLQAYADANGDGVAEKLYFPNRHLPVKKDLFSQIAWQLMTRLRVKVYAWMPVMAFDLGKNADYVRDQRTGEIHSEHYLRLNPYNPTNIKTIHEIYDDLGFYAKFNGILFHDDAFLSDYEGPIGADRSEQALNQQAAAKSRHLNQLTLDLEKTLSTYSLRGNSRLETARNLYAEVVLNPKAKQWFAQDYDEFLNDYNRVAIMAMPYMENHADFTSTQAHAWLQNLIRQANANKHADKVVFELQAKNWRTNTHVSETELSSWFALLKQNGVKKFGYYPDDFIQRKPNIDAIRSEFSLASKPRQ